jgi:hypothetical protein
VKEDVPKTNSATTNTDDEKAAEERIKALLADPVYGELNQYVYKIIKSQKKASEIEKELRQTDLIAGTTGTTPAKMLEMMKQAEAELGRKR